MEKRAANKIVNARKRMGTPTAYQRLYGRLDINYEGKTLTLFDRYHKLQANLGCSEEKRQKNESASPEECTREFLKELENEIKLVEQDQAIESERIRSEALRLPDQPQLDRLLRYEASLERNFDRTLNQLERLQRMRKGQPVPPPLNVNLSAS